MRIQPINNYNVNQKGKFITRAVLSEKEKITYDKFLKYKDFTKNNLHEFIDGKSYDIILKRSIVNPSLLEFWSSFRTVVSDKQENVFISIFHPNNATFETDILAFYNGNEWFENYKKDSFGYNSKFEKFLAELSFFFIG